MRTLKALALAALIAFAGCKAKPTFHVTSALDPCSKGILTGTISGVEYALTPPGDPNSPEYLGQACYGMLEPGDVGKNFPAEIKPGSLTITVLGTPYQYRIVAAREVSK